MNSDGVDRMWRLDRGVENHMAWMLLLVAGLLEVGWAIGLKYTDGFTKLWPSIFTIASMVVSVVLLGIAMKSLPVGTSYAVWVGVGAVGTAILGIVLLGESAAPGRLVSLGLIVAGIVGLKLASSA
jgi:quaternary ammonium compound-resistance protein SugE